MEITTLIYVFSHLVCLVFGVSGGIAIRQFLRRWVDDRASDLSLQLNALRIDKMYGAAVQDIAREEQAAMRRLQAAADVAQSLLNQRTLTAAKPMSPPSDLN